ncbi:MAG TPA: glycosyltransferase [Streptosporangiaceae bacterium]
MGARKFSIVIPYKQRLDNIKLAFASLADQTMDRSEYEVVVGALEYSPEFTALCEEYADRLDITVVMSGVSWNVCHARNVAMRQASGQVIVIYDADMVVPPGFLRNLYDRYYQHGQNICVIGQMIGYLEIFRTEVEEVEALPYSHYKKVLADLEATGKVIMDARWTPEYASAFARFPWVQACTALVSLPAATVREHGLTFDEGFRKWGPEDQEWARRISLTGTPIVLGDQVYGVHVPHVRNQTDQVETEIMNWRYYLSKWPELDVEVAIAFDQLDADRFYPEVVREVAEAVPDADHQLGVVRGTISGRTVLVVGAVVDRTTRTPGRDVTLMLDDHTPYEVLPLAGLALPYSDGTFDECRILSPITKLSKRYQDIVVREAERVARKLVAPATDERR